MKKILFAICIALSMIATSCTNDEINVYTEEGTVKDAAIFSVSLSDFYQSYNYVDTKHNISVAESFRSFNSESNKFIQVLVLIYNKDTGELVNYYLDYTTNTNKIDCKADLPEGQYYAITTLTFADGKDLDDCCWAFDGLENIHTAKMSPREHATKWSIMSESAESFTVTKNHQTSVTITPKPVGSLCYFFAQNFQYKDESQYGTVSDNNVRAFALYTQNLATEYNLDPNSSSKYNYAEDPGKKTWWKLLYHKPQDYKKDWTFFKADCYSYCYILAPKFNLCFGYVLKGADGFNQYGETSYTSKNGSMILAYWNWFSVGNPYFGPADNNHWN